MKVLCLASLVAQSLKCLPAMRETWVRSLGLIPGSGRSLGEGNGNPLWYSCLENPMNGGAWWATVHGVVKSRTRLSDLTCTFFHFFTCIFTWIKKSLYLDINNLRYADNTTLMAESEEELKSLSMKVKEKSEKGGLKLNVQKTKIMASGHITSWQIDGETMETVIDFSFWAPKSLQMVTEAMKLKNVCSLEEKL